MHQLRPVVGYECVEGSRPSVSIRLKKADAKRWAKLDAELRSRTSTDDCAKNPQTPPDAKKRNSKPESRLPRSHNRESPAVPKFRVVQTTRLSALHAFAAPLRDGLRKLLPFVRHFFPPPLKYAVATSLNKSPEENALSCLNTPHILGRKRFSKPPLPPEFDTGLPVRLGRRSESR